MMRVLIAGCGYVGSELARRLVAGGHDVWGLRRTATGMPEGVRALAGDVTDAATLDLPDGIDALVYAVSPAERDEAAYRAAYVDGLDHVLTALPTAPERLVFVSSTAVYGQTDGSVVDEDSPTEPSSFSGRVLLEAEARARAAGGTVLRLAGIYGPGRTRLIDEVRAGEATYPPEDVHTNRIHRDDCAGALAHLLTIGTRAPVYVGVDDEPALRREVLTWLAERLDAPPPRAAPGQRTRGGDKRCSNARLRASGYDLAFPSYRDGYAAMLG
ncbi:MAG: SDR family oxidoreductase [Actinobacteria bacterium]|nr:SDR family oxidoreductase [Actinomycetota bacterium]